MSGWYTEERTGPVRGPIKGDTLYDEYCIDPVRCWCYTTKTPCSVKGRKGSGKRRVTQSVAIPFTVLRVGSLLLPFPMAPFGAKVRESLQVPGVLVFH